MWSNRRKEIDFSRKLFYWFFLFYFFRVIMAEIKKKVFFFIWWLFYWCFGRIFLFEVKGLYAYIKYLQCINWFFMIGLLSRGFGDFLRLIISQIAYGWTDNCLMSVKDEYFNSFWRKTSSLIAWNWFEGKLYQMHPEFLLIFTFQTISG